MINPWKFELDWIVGYGDNQVWLGQTDGWADGWAAFSQLKIIDPSYFDKIFSYIYTRSTTSPSNVWSQLSASLPSPTLFQRNEEGQGRRQLILLTQNLLRRRLLLHQRRLLYPNAEADHLQLQPGKLIMIGFSYSHVEDEDDLHPVHHKHHALRGLRQQDLDGEGLQETQNAKSESSDLVDLSIGVQLYVPETLFTVHTVSTFHSWRFIPDEAKYKMYMWSTVLNVVYKLYIIQ